MTDEQLATYTAWCDENGFEAVPAKDVTVVAYLMRQSDITPADIKEFRSELAAAHISKGLPNPFEHPALSDMLGKITYLTLPGE